MRASENLSLNKSIKDFEKKQIVISVLVLIIFLGISLIANRLYMQSIAEQTSKLISRMIQINDFREVSITLQSAKLDYFHTIEFKAASQERSFTFPPQLEYNSKKPFLNYFIYEKIVLNPEIGGSSTNDLITFEYNRFNFFYYALAIWFILNLVSIPQTRLIKRKIIAQFEKDIETEKRLVHAEVSQKVRHNINTPLAALMTMTSRLEQLSQADKDLFQSIVKQIKSLVKDLELSESQTNSLNLTSSIKESSNESLLIYQVLKESFSEIRLAFSENYHIKTDLDEALMSAKLTFTPHELRSILSNMVQNAADASNTHDEIRISAKDLISQLEIVIQDFGAGIPESLLNKVTDKNFSYGKKGSGLGLFHAKSWITTWGGQLIINSTEEQGTTIKLVLPINDRANWFTPRLKLHQNQTVVILDDHKSQHLVWQMKLSESNFKGDVKVFNTSEQFLNYRTLEDVNSKSNNMVYLFDYDLGPKQPKGLDILKSLPRESLRYLVTGHFDDPALQKICDEELIFIIPKPDVGSIALVVV